MVLKLYVGDGGGRVGVGGNIIGGPNKSLPICSWYSCYGETKYYQNVSKMPVEEWHFKSKCWSLTYIFT